MATSNSISASAPKQEPLDALQSLINDVLVQTGKALRASRKDSRGNLAHIPSPSQSKLPETIRLFHSALDELEEEIIEAKSVLLRDLNELQERKKKLLAQTQTTPQQPMTIDIPSASPEPKDEPMADSIDVKPMAPFPNMSINLSEGDHMDISAKEPNGQQPQPPPPGGMNGINGKASPAFASRLPAGDHKPSLDMLPETAGRNQPPVKAEPSGMNFTNMEFTLAPPSNEAQTTTSSKEPFFDLTTFAPADGGDDMLNLNNLLPDQPSAGNNNNNNNNNQPSISAAAHSISVPNANANANANATVKSEEAKFDANLNTEFFGNDSGAADGMDFDFSLGGSGDDTFDDLMNNRDSNFELMDAGGDFDSAFFGLDKPDESAA
ncbi:hypothetical protein ACQKWADRAFT_300198 [Trichoderma austrokoningii]